MILTDRALIRKFTEAGVWGEARLPDLLRSAAQRMPEKLAVADPPNCAQVTGHQPRRLTYSDLASAIRNMVKVFRSLKLERDDVVAFQLPSTIEQIVVIAAALECGLIVSPVPLLWRAHELKTALPLIAPKVLLTTKTISGRDHEQIMCAAAADVHSVIAVLAFGEGVMDGVIALDAVFSDDAPDDDAGEEEILQQQASANDVATICWAGGDSLIPCPVPRSHNQWIAAGMMSLLEAEIDERSIVLCPYPLNGLVSIGAFLVPWLMTGCTLLLHHPFDVPVFADQLRSEGVTVAALPPVVIDLLKDQGAFETEGAASGLKTLMCIWPGPLLPKDAEERAADLMANVIDIRSFGEVAYLAKRRIAGESPAVLEHGELTYPTRKSGGAVLLQTRVKGGISSNKQMASLLSGDLMIKSPMLFDAYFPAAIDGVDEPVLSKDSQGFINTGMRCLLTGTTAPKIEIIRRRSNVIFYGGLSVSANELDQLYSGFHGVSDAAAYSFEDPVMGERIIAAIVPEPGMIIAFDEFVEYLKDRQVAAYKLPDRMVTVKSIPRDSDGMVLRDQVMEHI